MIEKRIVFCDFDGTITTEDTFVNVCSHFAPEAVDRLLPSIFDGHMTLKDGIRQIVESIPSSMYPDMLDYVNNSTIRPGLDEFLDFLDEEEVPFVIISGGLKGLVTRQLGTLNKRISDIYAADVDINSEYIKVISKFDDGPELVNKTQVMQQYDYTEAVALGDGVTDHGMAMAASFVFARGQLARYLDKNNKSYERWSDFYDVKEALISRWR
jgi:2-hydroxy-3-keto-5-methylthiopentenyl-1-phosphate phosphatase